MRVGALLGFARGAGALECGRDACLRSVEKGKAIALVLAADASPRVSRVFQALSREKEIPLLVWGTKAELGAAAGRRDTAVAAVCDRRFSGAVRSALSKRDIERSR